MADARRARACAVCSRAISSWAFRLSASAIACRRVRRSESAPCWLGARLGAAGYGVDDGRVAFTVCADAALPEAASAHSPRIRRMLSLKVNLSRANYGKTLRSPREVRADWRECGCRSRRHDRAARRSRTRG